MYANTTAERLAYFEAHRNDKLLVTVTPKAPKGAAPVLKAVLKGTDYGTYENTRITFSNLGFDRRFVLECDPVKKAPAGVVTIPFGDLWPRMREIAS